MELGCGDRDLLGAYLERFGALTGDARTKVTFQETVKGIISAGSLVCQRVAAKSAILSAVHDFERLIRVSIAAQGLNVGALMMVRQPEDEPVRVKLLGHGRDGLGKELLQGLERRLRHGILLDL